MRAIALIIAYFFVAVHSHAQCPPRDSLWNRIIYLRDQSGVPLREQQKELLPYLDKMQQCPYKNDSTHTLLIGRIGALYFLQGDYLTGMKYIKEQMKMIYENA